ncbi:mannose-1-phosphate guanylyltransferase [Vicingus serpentipes]|uniref:mannose-1-phosphate guanylyltransferase n=1 Tax=Vicingus serpentipes TaxID=1926625 RepID=A0A5C6RPS2_9FLAO|nr:mannose-1-phosphate guanylyltransferase [Vicingus serpentipes]TXB63955.1 mannose-1-phosphate guanylyltransferase [Vicingus serpentipes]
MNTNNYCVIMAGGIGSRFWPMSKTSHPKQFIDILGTGQTLIQQTYSRLKKICPEENIYIVTNEMYEDLIIQQLAGITKEQIICEPSRKNTAPCIAYANYKIAEKNPNANIVVAPADHLILKEDEFVKVVNMALAFTENNDCLVTLGITPSRPDTGYGYIQFDTNASANGEIKKVKTFTEKPDLELAKQFVESGEFCWNSGMFIWSLKSINKAFETLLPTMDGIFKEGVGLYNTPAEKEFINKSYSVCKNISIDYGIMEKSNNVHVISADIGWSDLGTWGSIYTHLDHDDQQNAVVGDNVMLYDSEKNIINVPKDKLVVLQGLDDFIVVDTNEVLMVCKKQDEQKIKQFVNDIKLSKDAKYY